MFSCRGNDGSTWKSGDDEDDDDDDDDAADDDGDDDDVNAYDIDDDAQMTI